MIDFLMSKGFTSDDLKPTSKITEDMYRVLQTEFQQDKAAKQKAEQIDLPKDAIAESKNKRDEEDFPLRKKKLPQDKGEAPRTPPPEEVPSKKPDPAPK